VARGGKTAVEYQDVEGKTGSVAADMVVVCPAVTGAGNVAELSRLLDASRDGFGFFEELHGRLDSARSKVKGIYLAGACQAPMDIQQAISQGMAAAGYILSGLAEGKRLEIEPITASVNDEMCSRCRTCGAVCPYKAISYPADRESAYVNALLCHGCGTCVAACPAGAIQGNHFTNEQIFAEIEAILQ
jgi:heterodisulfide reductase subunit A